MLRDNKPARIAKLRERAAELRRQRQESHDIFFNELVRNPNTGWMDSFQQNKVFAYLQKNEETYKRDGYNHFLDMGVRNDLFPTVDERGKRKPPEAFVENVLQGREFTLNGKNYRPPFYFELEPRGNHFVLVKVLPGGEVQHYNELHNGTYDEECVRILKTMGFAADKIHMRETKDPKYIQNDSWSCGDRAIRNFEEAIGSPSPHKTSAELRQHTHDLLETVWRQSAAVLDIDDQLDLINTQLASLDAEPVAEPAPATSVIYNPEEDKKMPVARRSFCAPDVAARIKEELHKTGWQCTDNTDEDGKLVSISVTRTDKKDNPDYKFEIQNDQIYSQSKEKETFKAMLMAFKQTYPGLEPRINTSPKENVQKWQEAYCEVYAKKAAPPDVVNFLEPAPKTAPAPKEDKTESHSPKKK